ncbi:MAG: 3-phosphoshikimate 1-carboxyvinyltransferase [Gemmatimonadota bacterium]
MSITIEPVDHVLARLRVPGDKSISHRALILNAIARGRARVTNLAPGDDVAATLEALRALGVGIERPSPGTALVRGGGGWRAAPIDCRNSATTARLLLGLLAARTEAMATLTGDGSLRRRPMRRVVDPLRAMGAAIEERGEAGRLPLAVTGRQLAGRAHRLEVASAQVKSALLLAGLGAEGETSIEEPAISRDHTERMLAAMGAQVNREEEGASRVHLRPGPLEGMDVDVPGDLSSAAPFLVLAASSPGGAIVAEDVGLNPTRSGLLTILRRMGAEVATELKATGPEPRGTIRVAGERLVGVEIAGDEVPRAIDELPLVAVLATQAQGVTRVAGAGELRVKESDRIEAITTGLRAMGARIEATDTGFEVEGPTRLRGCALDAAGDHRIAIALAVAARLARGPSRLEGAEWVVISYPDFFEDLARTGGESPRPAGAGT